MLGFALLLQGGGDGARGWAGQWFCFLSLFFLRFGRVRTSISFPWFRSSHLMMAIYGLEIMTRIGIRDTGLFLSNGVSDGEAREKTAFINQTSSTTKKRRFPLRPSPPIPLLGEVSFPLMPETKR